MIRRKRARKRPGLAGLGLCCVRKCGSLNRLHLGNVFVGAGPLHRLFASVEDRDEPLRSFGWRKQRVPEDR